MGKHRYCHQIFLRIYRYQQNRRGHYSLLLIPPAVTALLIFTGDEAPSSFFKADPVLINPGDEAWITAYLTLPDSSTSPANPPMELSARIANLPAIEQYHVPPAPFQIYP